MKIFILTNVGQLTNNWHSGGGLVIVAENLEAAKELIKNEEEIKITDDEWNGTINYDLNNHSSNIGCYYIFPDAGCC